MFWTKDPYLAESKAPAAFPTLIDHRTTLKPGSILLCASRCLCSFLPSNYMPVPGVSPAQLSLTGVLYRCPCWLPTPADTSTIGPMSVNIKPDALRPCTTRIDDVVPLGRSAYPYRQGNTPAELARSSTGSLWVDGMRPSVGCVRSEACGLIECAPRSAVFDPSRPITPLGCIGQAV